MAQPSFVEPIQFGTDGWRSVIADTYTFDNVRVIAQALAQHLLKNQAQNVPNGVAIGYDTRFLSQEFARAAAETLAQNGVPAWLSDRDCPTPAIAWATRSRQCAAGIMITASHNPPKYNGFKFLLPQGRGADTASTKSVESFLRREPSTRIAPAKVTEFDARPAFMEQLRQVIDVDLLKKARGRAVCDFVHGVGRNYLDDFLRECDWEVTTLRGNPNPMFGGILPDPANPACHKALQEMVLETKADLGLANDPDADRFGAVDATGEYITPNQVLALVYLHLLEHRQMEGAVARTVATTCLLDAIARRHNQKVVETAVGFKWLGEKIDDGEAILGGEESGGLSIANHCPNKDGIVADLLIAEVWAADASKTPLSTRYAQVMEKYGTFYSDRIDVHLSAEAKDKLMNEMKTAPPQQFAGVKVANVVSIDGVKLNLEDGSWLLLRASGTEPLVRVYFEAQGQGRLEELRKAASELSD
ncbi:MAG TPA: phosphoglucomutase/phosphomannomutase family protein [Abditibacteriaceae bacterium]|nr:phosphoglucomutase/phosphomannomutase family protein [Abditibacteriaceae bacterium]